MSDPQKDDLTVRNIARGKLAVEKDPIARLRLRLLIRGASGIKGFSRQFRLMDDNRDKKLTEEEFRTGCNDFGLDLDASEITTLFNAFDKDKSGSINFDEFLVSLRPPLNDMRTGLIKKAFDKMDKSGDGVVTAPDLKGVYNVSLHPKYQNGEWTEDQVFKHFLQSFEFPNDADGKVTWEEWLNYYCGVSSSIDKDSYFALMMRNSWKL